MDCADTPSINQTLFCGKLVQSHAEPITHCRRTLLKILQLNKLNLTKFGTESRFDSKYLLIRIRIPIRLTHNGTSIKLTLPPNLETICETKFCFKTKLKQ